VLDSDAVLEVHPGAECTPDKRADLSPDTGFPFAAEFNERIALRGPRTALPLRNAHRHPHGTVHGELRAVWEPRHARRIPLDPHRLDAVVTTCNGHLNVMPGAVTESDGALLVEATDPSRIPASERGRSSYAEAPARWSPDCKIITRRSVDLLPLM